jgi:hypothetical protein
MLRNVLVATFTDADSLLRAVTPVRNEKFRIHDVYAPYPIHGLDEAMGIRRTKLPLVTLLVGLMGLTFAITFQFYTTVLDWPMNVGGKPDNSTLAFIPITFELTILAAGMATAKLFLARSRLFPGAPARLAAPRVTDDRFAIALRWRTSPFDTGEARRLLRESGAVEIVQEAKEL